MPYTFKAVNYERLPRGRVAKKALTFDLADWERVTAYEAAGKDYRIAIDKVFRENWAMRQLSWAAAKLEAENTPEATQQALYLRKLAGDEQPCPTGVDDDCTCNERSGMACRVCRERALVRADVSQYVDNFMRSFDDILEMLV